MKNHNSFNIVPLEERIVLDAAAAAIIYVNINAAGSIHDGTSWAHAYTSLQSALQQAAATPGPEQIWVAKGTYTPGSNSSASFNLPNNVSLYGGFSGCETYLYQRNIAANPTILSGDILGNDLAGTNPLTSTDPGYLASLADNSLHIITANGVTATLDGFTVSGAYNTTTVRGGALSGSNDILTLNHMTFVNNYTDGGGGGAIGLLDTASLTSTLTIKNSLFNNDTTSSAGGAIRVNFANLTMVNDVLSNNIGRSGAGGLAAVDTNCNISFTSFIGNTDIRSDSSALSITNNVNNIVSNFSFDRFQGNVSGGGIGGAIDLVNFSPSATNTVNFDHTDFNGNSGPNYGGAVNYGRLVGGSITYSSFENNTSKWGGALSVGAPSFVTSGPSAAPITIYMTTFVNNTASDMGGAIYDLNAASMTISLSLFAGNTAGRYGGAIEVDNINPGSVVPMSFDGGIFSVTNSAFLNNTAVDGGAVSFQYQPVSGYAVMQSTVSNDVFYGNRAQQGSDYYQSGGIATVMSNAFLDNAVAGGSLIAINGSTSTVNGYNDVPDIVNSLLQSNCNLLLTDILTF